MRNNDYKKMKDIIFYARKMIPVPAGTEDNTMLAMTALKNLSDYGFTIDQTGFDALKTASKDDITDWYYATSKVLNEMAGGNHKYHPFYPDFPEQVMAMSDLELFIDQIKHSISIVIEDLFLDEAGHFWQPDNENSKEGIKSLEEHPLKTVATYREDDKDGIAKLCSDIFKNTLKSKTMPSASDVDKIVNGYIEACPSWEKDATVVENRQMLTYLYTKAVIFGRSTDNFPPLVTNDYLRLAEYYSWMKVNGKIDISGEDFGEISKSDKNGKAERQKIVSLPNQMRKMMAKGLDGLKNLEEDVARNKPQWKAVFKIMHVGAMPQYENLNAVAHKLRNNESLSTFHSRIEKAFKEGRETDAVKMYASRPGEFVKALNRLISVDFEKDATSDEAKKAARGKAAVYVNELVKATNEVLPKVRPEDLVRLVTYLNSRTREDRIPVHNVKGKLVMGEKNYGPIAKETAEMFKSIAKNAIGEQIKTGVPYGKVYIDSALKSIPLPTEVADTSEAMASYPRGSRLPLERNEDGTMKNVRAYVWWTNLEHPGNRNYDNGRVDLDLSAEFFKEEDGRLERVDSVSYHSGFNLYGLAVHSGDMQDGGKFGGNGVAEFVDLNMEALKSQGYKYVCIYVNDYTGDILKDVNCLGGWQERDELDKSSQFDIKAVKQTSVLNCDKSGETMEIIDVQNGEIVWIDSPDRNAQRYSNSMDMASSFELLIDRYCKGDQMSMYEMAEIAVKANGGEIVDNMEEANLIFSRDEVKDVTEEQRVITSKDQDVWLGEFMSPQMAESEAAVEEAQMNEPVSPVLEALQNVAVSQGYEGQKEQEQENPSL